MCESNNRIRPDFGKLRELEEKEATKGDMSSNQENDTTSDLLKPISRLPDATSELLKPINRLPMDVPVVDATSELLKPINRLPMDVPVVDTKSELSKPINRLPMDVPVVDTKSELSKPINRLPMDVPVVDATSELLKPINRLPMDVPVVDTKSELSKPINRLPMDVPVVDATSELLKPINRTSTDDLVSYTERTIQEMNIANSDNSFIIGDFMITLLLRTEKCIDTYKPVEIKYKFSVQTPCYCSEREVAVQELESFSWVSDASAGTAFLQNKKEMRIFVSEIRRLIRNPHICRRIVFQTNGWKNIQGQFYYVINDGVIGNHPLRMCGAEELKFQYNFAAVGNQAIFGEAMNMMGICSEGSIGTILFLYAHLSCMTTVFDLAGFSVKFLVALIGETNSRKTSLAWVYTKLFNREQDKPDITFTSTKGGIETMVAKYSDAPLLVDDFRPGVNSQQSKDMSSKLELLSRLYGDRVMITRMKGTVDNQSYPVRGGCVITGEGIDNEGIESSSTRRITLFIDRNQVNNDRLSYYQQYPYIFPTYLYDFLLYVTQNFDNTVLEIKKICSELRRVGKFCIPRVSEQYAVLMCMASIIMQYAKNRGFIDTVFEEQFLQNVNIQVTGVLKQNESLVKTQNPTAIILTALIDRYQDGIVELVAVEKCEEIVSDFYIDQDFFYISADYLHNLAEVYLRKMGIKVLLPEVRSMAKDLERIQVIKVSKEPNGTVRRTLKLPKTQKNKKRYLHIHKEAVARYLQDVEPF
jgi:hypothetical protein